MNMLFECHRIPADGGLLVLSTPRVARALLGSRSLVFFSADPAAGNADTPHVHEYTPRGVGGRGGRTRSQTPFTERISNFEGSKWVLDRSGAKGSMHRCGENGCPARRESAGTCSWNRYPSWLHAG